MMPTRKYNNQNWLPSIFNDFFDNEWLTRANATAPAINVIESDNADLFAVKPCCTGTYGKLYRAPLRNERCPRLHFRSLAESIGQVRRNPRDLPQRRNLRHPQKTFRHSIRIIDFFSVNDDDAALDVVQHCPEIPLTLTDIGLFSLENGPETVQ